MAVGRINRRGSYGEIRPVSKAKSCLIQLSLKGNCDGQDRSYRLHCALESATFRARFARPRTQGGLLPHSTRWSGGSGRGGRVHAVPCAKQHPHQGSGGLPLAGGLRGRAHAGEQKKKGCDGKEGDVQGNQGGGPHLYFSRIHDLFRMESW